ncbi:MAG: hypothetical protein ACTSRK_09495 [Promethearchaeota archaeon]
MPKKTTKSKKNVRIIACDHLVTLNAISNHGSPLCNCKVRKFTMSPFNIVCQICVQYKERKDEKTHEEMYVAEEAADFSYDLSEIDISDDDFEDEVLDLVEDDDYDDDVVVKAKPKKKGKSKKKVVEEEDEDEEEEEEFEEEDVALVIGVTKKEKEESVDYEDEREEGLGKKHRKMGAADPEEDEDLDEELEELEDDMLGMDDEVSDDGDKDDDSDTNDGSSVNFQKDVIDKIKTVGSGENENRKYPFFAIYPGASEPPMMLKQPM